MQSSILCRRSLLALMGAGAIGACTTAGSSATPFFKRTGLPIGLQLYTLGPDATKDLEGTLQAVADIGYRDIELAGLLGRTPQQMRGALDKAGLTCSAAHIQGRGAGADPNFGDTAKLADALHVLGARTAVLPSTVVPDRLDQRPAAGEGIADYLRRILAQLNADDWKMNADFLNAKAKDLNKAGIGVGYHNHNFEFLPVGGTTGFDILVNNTDPALVTFEMDIGWVAAAGADPLALLARHKGRFTMMHVKDIKPSTKSNFDLEQDSTEIGSGELDWKTLLPACHAAGIRSFFVEQEPPFQRPRLEAIRISHDYLSTLVA